MQKFSDAVKMPTRHPLTDTYLELLRDWSLWELPFYDAVRTILATVSSALNVRRVGLWSYDQNRQVFTMVSLFDATDASYSHGLEVARDNSPLFFSHLDSERVIAVADVASDPRTVELAGKARNPRDFAATLHASVRMVGRTWGVLAIEHSGGPRLWSEAEQWFATSVADLITQLIASAEVRDNERRLRFILDNLPMGVLKVDADAHCVYCNPHWLTMAGLAVAEVDGEGWLAAVHPEDRVALRDVVRAVVQSGEPTVFEARLLLRDKVLWVASQWVAECDAEGFPVGALGTFTDIMQQRALRENERRYRALFDNSGDAIFLMRADCFIDCNERTLEMFGCTREQIIGQPPYRFSPAQQPDGLPSKEAALQKIAGAFAGQRQIFEWRHSRYDGVEFDAEVTLTCVILEGTPHLLAAVRDISDRRYGELQLQQSYRRLRWINSLAAQLNGLRDIYVVAKVSAAILAEHSSAPVVWFYRYEEATGLAQLLATSGRIGSVELRVDGRVKLTFRKANLVGIIPNVATADLTEHVKQLLHDRGVISIVYVWLVVNEVCLGVVALEYCEPLDLQEEQREDLAVASKTIAMALSDVLHIEDMAYQANHDSLTGLPNRNALQRELNRLSGDSSAPMTGLMLLDLDRFKEINDALGHHVGDKVLCEIGPRLRTVLSEQRGFLCRLGGDEFAVLMPVDSAAMLRETAWAMLSALKETFEIDGLKLEIGGSIGVAVYSGVGESSHELLRHADVAMYAAKCGASVVEYSSQLDQNTPERLALMQELGAGIRASELVLHYQPKVELSSGRIVGVEALVRWQHPQRGLLPPSMFLPFAELGNTIHALTLNVLEQALEQQQQWQQQGIELSVAVNLSARNLVNEECCRQVQQLLRRYGTRAGMVELEITETSLMQDPDGAIKILSEFAELGVKLSIDDFGTGYSSLSYLRLLPIHALKIDRSFVIDLIRNEQDVVIVKSTIGLAHNLNLQVIAEGVEDAATLDLLKQLQCDMAQGYHLGRPQSAQSLTQLIAATL